MKNSQIKAGSVRANTDTAQGLHDLFVDELKDIFWCEMELIKAIPIMIRNITSEDLAVALTSHLEETRQQVARLEEVFASIDEKAEAKKCEATEGLIKKAKEIMENTKQGKVRDAGIISAAQKIEHYEIAAYRTLCFFAIDLGEDKAAALLEETLFEKKYADEKLSLIDVKSFKIKASVIDGEKEEDEEDNDMENATKTRRY